MSAATPSTPAQEPPKIVLLMAGLVLGFGVYVMWMHSYYWANVDDYSFGYLVPAFAAFVLYDRWPKIKQVFALSTGIPAHGIPVEAPSKESRLVDVLSAAAFVGALILLFAAALNRASSGPNALSAMMYSLSLSGVVLSGAWVVSAYAQQCDSVKTRLNWVSLFVFPAFIGLIAAPLAPAFEQVLRVFLLSKVTYLVVFVFDLLGIPIYREGTILVLPNGVVGVEDACSGIRSLTGCLFAGSFLAAVFLQSWWRKGLLVGCAALLAFVMNIFRSLFLTGWCHAYGPNAIDDPAFGSSGMSVHDVAGYFVLVSTTVILLVILPLFQISATPPPGYHPKTPAKGQKKL